MKSGSNFTNNCWWPLTGYLTVRNNNWNIVEICIVDMMQGNSY